MSMEAHQVSLAVMTVQDLPIELIRRNVNFKKLKDPSIILHYCPSEEYKWKSMSDLYLTYK